MKPSEIYSWAGDFFCSGCLIYAMIPHHPWSRWANERDVSEFSTNEALVDMAAYFHINLASYQDRADMSFPNFARQDQLESTLFCSTCLTLLNQVP